MLSGQYWLANFFQKKLRFVTGARLGCTVMICLFGLKTKK